MCDLPAEAVDASAEVAKPEAARSEEDAWTSSVLDDPIKTFGAFAVVAVLLVAARGGL